MEEKAKRLGIYDSVSFLGVQKGYLDLVSGDGCFPDAVLYLRAAGCRNRSAGIRIAVCVLGYDYG